MSELALAIGRYLGELGREMGNVERSYLDSFKTRKLIWDRQRDDSAETAARVETLRAWYKALDEEFELVLLAIPESEITYVPTVATHTIESLPITYSKR